MAIVEKVTLVDDYSAKAKNIAKSTSAIASAMDAIKGKASSFSSVMKSAFDRKYTVDIKETGSIKAMAKMQKLRRTMSEISGKPVDIKVTSKVSVFEKLKSNMQGFKSSVIDTSKVLNSSFKSGLSSAKSFKMDYSSFRKAKKEARDLEKELKKLTGRKHKVDIGMENPMKSAFKGGFAKMFEGLKSGFSKVGGIFSKAGGFFSKLNPFKGFGGGGVAGGPGGGGGLGMIGSIVGGNLITGAITRGLSALSGTFQTTIGKGFDRLNNIQAAKARLRGQTNADGSRKFDDAAIKSISKSAMDAVTKTAYGFGDAMTTASSAIAAGVKQEDLGGYLKDIANISAATGSDFNEIGSLMNKIQTTGKLQGDELMQLSDRGLPILDKIAEMKGVDQKTAREMISKGQISSKDAFKAASLAAGNSAKEMNETWDAAKMNFGSALSKLGAGLLGGSGGEEGGIFEAMTPALLKVNDALNDMIPSFQKAGDGLKSFVDDGIKKGKQAFGKTKDFLEPLTKKIGSKINKDSIKGFIGGGVEKAKKGLSAAKDFMAPIAEKVRDGLGKTFDKLAEVVGPLKEKFTAAFDVLAEAFAPVMDALSGFFGDKTANNFSILNGIIEIVSGALGVLADVIVALQPVWELLASFITDVVLPALSDLGTWVAESLVPKISELADIVGGWVKEAFEFVGNAVNAAKTAFDNLVGAVSDAASALSGLPGKIGSWVSDKINSAASFLGIGKKGHATGTEYFAGGMTQINERGQEMMRLPQGTKIYPAGKTDRIIRKEIKNTSNVDRSVSSPSITINVSGANMSNQDVGRVIANELRRLGVVV